MVEAASTELFLHTALELIAVLLVLWRNYVALDKRLALLELRMERLEACVRDRVYRVRAEDPFSLGPAPDQKGGAL